MKFLKGVIEGIKVSVDLPDTVSILLKSLKKKKNPV